MAGNHARLTVHLPASADVVRAHLTDPDLLVRWWPSGAETDPVTGGSYHLWWDGPGWHLRGRYLVVEEDRLHWTWQWDHDDIPARRVSMVFAAEADGTQLSIDHEADDPAERDSYLEGWRHFLAALSDLLAPG